MQAVIMIQVSSYSESCLFEQVTPEASYIDIRSVVFNRNSVEPLVSTGAQRISEIPMLET